MTLESNINLHKQRASLFQVYKALEHAIRIHEGTESQHADDLRAMLAEVQEMQGGAMQKEREGK